MNEQTSLTAALQKCIVLGGRADSEKLRDWARMELRGYEPDQDLPDYRTVRGMLCLDALLPYGGSIRGEQFSARDLPDFARDHISEIVPLREGIGLIEQLANASEETLKLQLPMSAELMRFMEAKAAIPGARIIRLYWAVSRASIRAVVEHVRTSLAELVSEMVALMPDDQTVPTKDAADQAVGLVVGGKRNTVNVVASQAAAGSTSRAEALRPGGGDGWWQRWRKRGLIVGASTVVAAFAGVATWLDWAPW